MPAHPGKHSANLATFRIDLSGHGVFVDVWAHRKDGRYVNSLKRVARVVLKMRGERLRGINILTMQRKIVEGKRS